MSGKKVIVRFNRSVNRSARLTERTIGPRTACFKPPRMVGGRGFNPPPIGDQSGSRVIVRFNRSVVLWSPYESNRSFGVPLEEANDYRRTITATCASRPPSCLPEEIRLKLRSETFTPSTHHCRRIQMTLRESLQAGIDAAESDIAAKRQQLADLETKAVGFLEAEVEAAKEWVSALAQHLGL